MSVDTVALLREEAKEAGVRATIVCFEDMLAAVALIGVRLGGDITYWATVIPASKPERDRFPDARKIAAGSHPQARALLRRLARRARAAGSGPSGRAAAVSRWGHA